MSETKTLPEDLGERFDRSCSSLELARMSVRGRSE